jgi:hypothetical protein
MLSTNGIPFNSIRCHVAEKSGVLDPGGIVEVTSGIPPSLYEFDEVYRWKNLLPPPGFTKAPSVVSFEKKVLLSRAQSSL